MKRLNAAEWDNHYSRWQSSNKSLSDFCRSEGLHYQRMCYWRQVKEGTKKRNHKSVFIKLPRPNASPGSLSTMCCELILLNGARLLLAELPQVDYLKALLS